MFTIAPLTRPLLLTGPSFTPISVARGKRVIGWKSSTTQVLPLATVAAAQAGRSRAAALEMPRDLMQAAEANHAATSLVQAAEAQQAAAASIASAAASLASAAKSLASIAAEAAAEAQPAPQRRSPPRRGAPQSVQPRPSQGKGSSSSGKGYTPF